MNHSNDEDHGPSLCLARNDAGAVAICGCGVVTLTLQYLSVRFEPSAFRSLVELLRQAEQRLDRGCGRTTTLAAEAAEADVAPQSQIH